MQPVQLSAPASTILVLFFIFSSLLLLVLIAAVAFLVWKLNAVLTRYEQKIEPILEKADSVLTLVAEKTDSIGGKAELLLTQGEEMAETVHEKVDRTATAVQRTINAPIIRANSLVAALTQGWDTFTRLQRGSPVANVKIAEQSDQTIVQKNKEHTVETFGTSVGDDLSTVPEATAPPVTAGVAESPEAREQRTPEAVGRL